MAALCNQFNPERIIVGGTLAAAGELLLDPLRQAVRALRAARRPSSTSRSCAGALGERAELLGALVLVLGQSDRGAVRAPARSDRGVRRTTRRSSD